MESREKSEVASGGSFNQPEWARAVNGLKLAVALSAIGYPSMGRAAPALTTLVSLNSDNGFPQASLIIDANGNLYGTTAGGGPDGFGSVFEVSATNQAVTTLGSFSGPNGYRPATSLLRDGAGNIYGVTGNGGSTYVSSGTPGYGSAFEIPAGSNSIVTLYSFNGPSGYGPGSSLVADAEGNLYGTTIYGGSYFTSPYEGGQGYGTLFEISSTTHTLTTILSFINGYGVEPSGLTKAPNGLFYGTTSSGGPSGYGTVFDFNPTTDNVTTLATFSYANGSSPNPGLAIDKSGDVYGTMGQGGAYGFGTIFKLAAGSTAVTTLFSFAGIGESPAFPRGGPIIDAQGNLFGTTENGGDANNDGTVFELPAGAQSLTTLAKFDYTDGQYPLGGLVADSAGNLYGTTLQGGNLGDGSVYEVTGSGFVVPEPANSLIFGLSALLLCRRRRMEILAGAMS